MSNPGTAARAPQARLDAKRGKKNRKKGRGGLIALIIILALVLTAAAFLYFNLFGTRTIVFGWLANVPIIGRLIPAQEGEDAAPRVNAAELQTRIDTLQRQVDSQTRDIENLRTANDGLQRENDRLRGFEAEQEQFKLDRDAFVTGMITDDTITFWKLVQQMDQELAAELARGAFEDAQAAREIRDFLTVFENMDPGTAGEIMDNLMDNNSERASAVIKALRPEISAPILEAMDSEKRAALTLLILPGGL